MRLVRVFLPCLLYGALASAETTTTVVVQGTATLVCAGSSTVVSPPTSGVPSSTLPPSTLTPSKSQAWSDLDCSIPAATDASIPVMDRWAQVGVEQAYIDATDYYINQSEGSSQFSKTLLCQDLADNDGCSEPQVQCDQFNNPAAYIITPSFIWLERTYSSMNSAITAASGQVSRQISDLLGVFAPQKKKGVTVESITLDIISLSFSLSVSPMWNKWLKEASALKNSANELGTVKDWVNPLVTQSITILKDMKMIQSQELANQEALDSAIAQLAEEWQSGLNNTVNTLFNGSTSSIAQLYNFIRDGKFFFDRVPSDFELQKDVQRAPYVYLIPNAWHLSRDVPFIFESEFSCENGEPVLSETDKQNWFWSTKEDGTASNFWQCIDDKAYYLVGADNKNGWKCDPDWTCEGSGFYPLHGAGELDGTNWGGITYQDIIKGSVNTWTTNQKENKGDESVDVGDGETLSKIIDDDLIAPGVFHHPVCGGKEAFNNWKDFSEGISGAGLGSTPNWPCN
ncbi:hypothetical protein BDW62DRAFT_208888 [Aspergillus aurantiobrunneus]